MTEMTVSEAGRKGGKTTAKRHGSGFYKQIGKMGGDANAKNHDRAHFQKLGRKGGAVVKALFDKEKNESS